jgi:peptide/nickel transport system permease protein
MTAYIVRRLLLLPVILFGVTVLVFLMLSQLSPGQRASLYVRDTPHQPGELQGIIEKYGLNDPIPKQYVRWIGRAAHGDLGYSSTGKEEVSQVILAHLPATVELALWAILPIIAVGIQFGILSALNHNRLIDQELRLFSIVGTSLPTFLAALLLLMLFAVKLGWLPVQGRLVTQMQRVVDTPGLWHSVTGMYTVDAFINGRLDVFLDAVRHIVLPVVTLSYISWAVLLRVTRSSMLETLRQDYVRTALAKGLAHDRVVRHHAFPNALLPVVTVCGWQLIGLLGGVAITETVYGWPGIGRRFVEAAVNLDVVTVLGFVLFDGVILILGNLTMDVLYAYLDPRVRLS